MHRQSLFRHAEMNDSSSILHSRQHHNSKHHSSQSFNHNRNVSREHDHSSQRRQPTPTQNPAPRKPLKPSSRHDSMRRQLETYLNHSPLDTAHNTDPNSRPIRSRHTNTHTNSQYGSKTNLIHYLQHPVSTSLHQLPVHPNFGPVPSVESPEQHRASELATTSSSTPPHTPPCATPPSPLSPQEHLLQETLDSIRKAAVGDRCI